MAATYYHVCQRLSIVAATERQRWVYHAATAAAASAAAAAAAGRLLQLVKREKEGWRFVTM